MFGFAMPMGRSLSGAKWRAENGGETPYKGAERLEGGGRHAVLPTASLSLPRFIHPGRRHGCFPFSHPVLRHVFRGAGGLHYPCP